MGLRIAKKSRKPQERSLKQHAGDTVEAWTKTPGFAAGSEFSAGTGPLGANPERG